jgi:hypothetical protein
MSILSLDELQTNFMTKEEYIEDMNNTLDGTNASVDTYIAEKVTPIETKLDDYFIPRIEENIAKLKERYPDLLDNIGNIDNSRISASSQLINDYNYLYNKAYLQNFSMLIGIGVGCLFLVKGFRK